MFVGLSGSPLVGTLAVGHLLYGAPLQTLVLFVSQPSSSYPFCCALIEFYLFGIDLVCVFLATGPRDYRVKGVVGGKGPAGLAFRRPGRGWWSLSG